MNSKKILKNVDLCFLKPKVTFSNVLFCPQLKDNQFSVMEMERNRKIFIFKKLESENFSFKKKKKKDSN